MVKKTTTAKPAAKKTVVKSATTKTTATKLATKTAAKNTTNTKSVAKSAAQKTTAKPVVKIEVKKTTEISVTGNKKIETLKKEFNKK